MADVVLILGAGASVDAGGPLMRDFFNQAEDLYLYHRDKLPSYGPAHFERVFDLRKTLQPLNASATLDLSNLEEIFALLELRRLLNPPALGVKDEDEESLYALRVLIAETLSLTVDFATIGALPPQASPTYRLLVELVKGLQASPASRSAAFVTFNYDLALEVALEGSPLLYDYCLDADKPAASVLPLLKPHGSLNWYECLNALGTHKDDMPRLVPCDTNRISRTTQPNHRGRLVPGYPMRLLDYRCPECGKPPRHSAPFLIAPTWNKQAEYRQVRPVWQRAYAEIQTARHLVVVGYSMPETDFFFRHLFALGTLGAAPLRSFTVVDPSKEVGDRFEALLGPATRRQFKHLQGRLTDHTHPTFPHMFDETRDPFPLLCRRLDVPLPAPVAPA